MNIIHQELHFNDISTFVFIASVTLREENYSGVRGEIQLVQKSDSDHVMIMGAITGLSPGIHGIYVHTDKKCSNAVSYRTISIIFCSRTFQYTKPKISKRLILDYTNTLGRGQYSK